MISRERKDGCSLEDCRKGQNYIVSDATDRGTENEMVRNAQ